MFPKSDPTTRGDFDNSGRTGGGLGADDTYGDSSKVSYTRALYDGLLLTALPDRRRIHRTRHRIRDGQWKDSVCVRTCK
jgi:hypothetical protein